MAITLAAGFAPARGFPPNQVIPATIVAVLITVGVIWGSVRYRQGRFAGLERVATAVERQSGMPAWAALPTLVTSASLDSEFWRAVSDWLADSWPFERVEYAARS